MFSMQNTPGIHFLDTDEVAILYIYIQIIGLYASYILVLLSQSIGLSAHLTNAVNFEKGNSGKSAKPK